MVTLNLAPSYFAGCNIIWVQRETENPIYTSNTIREIKYNFNKKYRIFNYLNINNIFSKIIKKSFYVFFILIKC